MGKRYNGWKNYETWNVALWIGNDEGWYTVAREDAKSYADFQERMRGFGIVETPDHVALNASGLDTEALDRLIRET